MPKVSVIIPTYNCAKYICEAVDSVLAQTYNDFEIVVVDDGSTDDTKDILQRYNGRIRYIYQSNKGVSAARNLGLREAKGKYIAFLDADDIWLPEKLECQTKLLEENPDTVMVFSDIEMFSENTLIRFSMSRSNNYQPYGSLKWRILQKEFNDGTLIKGITFGDLVLDNSILPATVVLKRICLDSIGYFDEGLPIAEDYDLWLRISQKFKILYFNKITARRRYRQDSASDRDGIREYKYLEYDCKVLKKFIKEEPNRFSSLIKKTMKQKYRIACWGNLNNLNLKKLRTLSWDSLSLDLCQPKLFFYILISLLPIKTVHFLKKMKLNIKNRNKIKTPPYKVIFLIHRLRIGGAEQRLYDYLRSEIKNKNFSFKIICLYEKGEIGQEIENLGIPIDVLKGNNFIQRLLNLIFYLRKEDPDIIHIHLWPARLFTPIIKLFSNASVIYTVEDQLEWMAHFEKLLEKLFYFLTNKIIFVSNSSNKSYCSKFKVNKKKNAIIYNGIDSSKFSLAYNSNFRKEQGLSDTHLIITSIARIIERKGHIYLVRAAKILQEKYSHLKFIIVGEGNYRESISREIKKLQLDDLFVLTGQRRDINNILSSTDIFVLPSLCDEGLPLCLLEAMAAGKPVITTNIEGINEVADINNAIIIPPTNSIALANGLEKLIIDREERLRLGEEAKKTALSRFSLEKMCNLYEKLYKEIIQK